MNTILNLIRQIWDKLFILLGVFFVLFPASPFNVQYASRDSGAFLYVGWRILNGELPYKDVWDHKPPLIFYIDALGIMISNESKWGIWLIEFLSLSLAAFIAFAIIRNTFGIAPALISTTIWLSTLALLIGDGNMTTEYALPLQFIALWLARGIGTPRLTPLHWFLIGFTGGIAFSLKQTTIGIWISIVLFLIIYNIRFRNFKEIFSKLSILLSGFLVVITFWIVFFGLQSGLQEFWDVAFRYNLFYSFVVEGMPQRLLSVIIAIRPLSETGLLQFAGFGYLYSLLLVRFKNESIKSWLSLLTISLINLPIEFALIAIPGRPYYHYYMTALPALSIFAGIAFWIIFTSSLIRSLSNATRILFVLGTITVILFAFGGSYGRAVFNIRKVDQQARIVARIQSMTKPGDTVLVWGAESAINYFSGRASPTRYVYQYPLYTNGYTSEEIILEFLDSIIKNRPKLIIDTKNEGMPIYQFPIQTEKITKRIQYIQCSYKAIDIIKGIDWLIYEYANKSDCVL